ncbi:MAG: hypothetical protein LBD33_01840 [Puniceicoccales bacterium]|nr:hypothetical protein [Puniceicoccales bacterium]
MVMNPIREEYNERYQELIGRNFKEIHDKYDKISSSVHRIPQVILSALGPTGDPQSIQRHLELAAIMHKISRLVRYGSLSNFTSTELQSDLCRAHNQDVLRYDLETNKFISPCMPVEAEFCTRIKQEFDASHLNLTKAYRADLPKRIAILENQAREEVQNGAKNLNQVVLPFFELRWEIAKLDEALGYTGNTCSISSKDVDDAEGRILALAAPK